MIAACDRCGKPEAKDRPVKRMFIVTWRGLDAAGSMDDFGDNVDLCVHCMASLLSQIIARRDYNLNTDLLAKVRKGIQ